LERAGLALVALVALVAFRTLGSRRPGRSRRPRVALRPWIPWRPRRPRGPTVFQLTRRSLRLQLAASLNAPVDLLAQARIVAVDVVDAAIAQPAPTASKYAAATAKTGTPARFSALLVLTSSNRET
jgi:hypothetical protein